MFNRKKGFTLAELLLVLGIIGVVTAMGMVITKKTTEQAYKKYFYTGYSNLYSAVSEVASTNMPQSTPQDLENSIAQIFSNSKNNIAYRVRPQQVDSKFLIDMKVPQPKTRQNPNAEAWTRFLYAPDNGANFLIPLAQEHLPNGYISLQDRPDLLQAYVDDGLTGRNVDGVMGGSGSVRNVAPMSFKAAYCRCRGDYGINATLQDFGGGGEEQGGGTGSFIIIDCGGVAPAVNGVLKYRMP